MLKFGTSPNIAIVDENFKPVGCINIPKKQFVASDKHYIFTLQELEEIVAKLKEVNNV